MKRLALLFLIVVQYSFAQSYTDPSNDIKLSVHPNPFTNYVSIDSNGYEYDAVLFNIAGEAIEMRYNTNGQVDTTNLASGIYVLRLSLGSMVKSFKLLKE